MKNNLICINCPQGCHLDVDFMPETGKCVVSGNRCKRGEDYAIQEMTNPCRIVTAVVPTVTNDMPYLPVRTDKPIQKTLIPALLNSLYKMKISAPRKMGDIIIENYEQTGVNIIASESL